MYTGLKDNRSGIGPVSSTTGRQSSASVGELYLPSVGRARYSTGTDGLVIATVYETGRRSDSEDKAVAGNRKSASISDVGGRRKLNTNAVTMYGSG